MSAAKKNPSPYTAHLVVWFDMSGPTPRVVDQGIYSEARPSSANLRTRYPVPMIHGQGSTYENAKINLRRYCSSQPEWRWALPLFEDGR